MCHVKHIYFRHQQFYCCFRKLSRVNLNETEKASDVPFEEAAERFRFLVWWAQRFAGARTAGEFAVVVGRPATSISKWAQGKQRADYDTLLDICQRITEIAPDFDIDAAWLYNPISPRVAVPGMWERWRKARDLWVSRYAANFAPALPLGERRNVRVERIAPSQSSEKNRGAKQSRGVPAPPPQVAAKKKRGA